jgi:hypothetical protein
MRYILKNRTAGVVFCQTIFLLVFEQNWGWFFRPITEIPVRRKPNQGLGIFFQPQKRAIIQLMNPLFPDMPIN